MHPWCHQKAHKDIHSNQIKCQPWYIIIAAIEAFGLCHRMPPRLICQPPHTKARPIELSDHPIQCEFQASKGVSSDISTHDSVYIRTMKQQLVSIHEYISLSTNQDQLFTPLFPIPLLLRGTHVMIGSLSLKSFSGGTEPANGYGVPDTCKYTSRSLINKMYIHRCYLSSTISIEFMNIYKTSAIQNPQSTTAACVVLK